VKCKTALVNVWESEGLTPFILGSFGVLTAVCMKITLSLNVKPGNPVITDVKEENAVCIFNVEVTYLGNICNDLPEYTESYPRRK
jgi:hypothetical protein